MSYINIQLIKMPLKIKATHTVNEDGGHTVFLNNYYPIEELRKAYLHELKHIARNDLSRQITADEIEVACSE